jgi:hypothetical protein
MAKTSGDNIEYNWKAARPPRRHAAQAVVVAWFLAIALLIFLIIAASLFNRPLVLIVCAIYVLVLLSMFLIRRPLRQALRAMSRPTRRAIRIVRGHKWRTLAVAVALGAFGLLVLAFIPSHDNPPSIGFDIVSVPYVANMSVNGETAILNERITIDKQAKEEANVQEGSTPVKWSRGPVIDGEPTFHRQSVFHVRLPTLGAATLEIPINLGEINPGESRPTVLEPRDASTFKIIARKGAIAATYPATTGKADLLNHLEETVVGIEFDDSVRLAVLSPVLQNQAGVMAYQVIAWGPLPWVTGFVMILVLGALWKRLTDSLDQGLKRIVPRRKNESEAT